MNVAQQLRAAAAERILIKDGAYGTQVQNRRLREADYAGSLGLSRDQKGNNDLLNLTQPELVRDICQSFADPARASRHQQLQAKRISQADYGARAVRESTRAARIIAESPSARRRRTAASAWGWGPGPDKQDIVAVAKRQRSGYARSLRHFVDV